MASQEFNDAIKEQRNRTMQRRRDITDALHASYNTRQILMHAEILECTSLINQADAFLKSEGQDL